MRNKFTFEFHYQELSSFDEVISRRINCTEPQGALQQLTLLNLEDLRVKTSRKLATRFKKCMLSLSRKEAIALYLVFGIQPDTALFYGYSTIFRINSETHKDLL